MHVSIHTKHTASHTTLSGRAETDVKYIWTESTNTAAEMLNTKTMICRHNYQPGLLPHVFMTNEMVLFMY